MIWQQAAIQVLQVSVGQGGGGTEGRGRVELECEAGRRLTPVVIRQQAAIEILQVSVGASFHLGRQDRHCGLRCSLDRY